MRAILIVLFTFLVTLTQANTYYFSSNSGDDNRSKKDAENPSTPWRTINKFNSFSDDLKPGDIVLFKSGEVFYGSLKLSANGTASKPITIGAYGSGSKPVITGLQALDGWSPLGGGIYAKSNLSLKDNLNMVVFNDAVQPIGRWPKVNAPNNGYLINYQGGFASIRSKEISGAPNFIGGEVVMRKFQWLLDRATITYQDPTIINYSSHVSPAHPSFTYNALDGHGFFFQNHVNTLTTLGDWCYEPASKTLKMYFGSNNPDWFTVKVTNLETLVGLSYCSYINFNNISFSGSNVNAFNIYYSTNIQINNCDINYSGVNAINVTNSHTNDIKVQNSTITNTNNNAINGNNSPNWIIRNNIIRNTGTVRGMGISGDAQYNAIQYVGSNSIVEYNEIRNTGYIGIHFIGDNAVIKNNVIDSFCMIKSDGGGIYTYGETGSVRKIIGNIVSNGIGDLHGINVDLKHPYSGQVHGIYMDGNSSYVTIDNNTCFSNAQSGLFLGSSTNISVINNLLYNNDVVQLRAIDSKGALSNINIKNNVFVARDTAQLVTSFQTNGQYNIGSVDYNYYCRPLYEPQSINTGGYPNVPTFFNYPG